MKAEIFLASNIHINEYFLPLMFYYSLK